jgi:hypothetical protein
MRTSPRALLLAGVLVGGLLAPGSAWAKKPKLFGTVVNRNGEALARVNVKLSPGNVEIITDDTGKFTIDYLRDAEGNRVKLSKKTTYEFEYFKVGYAPQKVSVDFKRGELILEPITLQEDTISVKASNDNIDPGLYPDRAQNSGGSYEGE